MLSALEPVAAAFDLTIPEEHRRPIGVVGAGAIVDVAHLPAYRARGLEVQGIFDIDRGRAEDVQRRHGLSQVYKALGELLADEDIEVVDIAVVPDAQPEIIRMALQAGKHVLAQKPLAPTLAEAAELAGIAEYAGRQLVVNQQMRYGEGMAIARAMVTAGWIGAVTAVDFHVNIATDWTAWGWIVGSPQLDLRYHSIHYLDSIRALLGDPDTAYCLASRRPGQVAAGETRTMSALAYRSGPAALLHINHENIAGDYEARFRVDGEAGSIRGTIGLLYDYPHGRPDSLEVWSKVLPTDGWLPYPITTRWIPDAFAGPMHALLTAAATGKPAPTCARDNLGTLALLESLYRSAETGSVQVPARP
jgi:predicted dehydrogenase